MTEKKDSKKKPEEGFENMSDKESAKDIEDIEALTGDELGALLEDLVVVNGQTRNNMPIIPLRGLSIFPFMVLHFDVGREKSISALESAMMDDQIVFLVSQKNADTDLPAEEDFYQVGTVAKIKQMLRLPGDAIRVLVEGISRGVLDRMLYDVPYFRGEIVEIKEAMPEVDLKMEALTRSVLGRFEEYLELSPKASREIFPSVVAIETPGRMADIITSHLEIKIEEKQAVLEAFDVYQRLEKVSEILVRELQILSIEQDINAKVKNQINKTQKEYYLREQLKAIQSELGQEESAEDEYQEWIKGLDELKLEPKLHAKIEKEMKRILKLQPSSPESGVIRTYVEWILALPWNKSSKDKLDLKKAKQILDEDHYGLDKVKERVLEYLAVMSLSKRLKGPILCLVGPPGVGKTSVAKSVARSLNREFVRMSLGGVRDEAEIRGHRRTYIGAIPGRIISAMKDAGTNNPVFLFDEVDKIGNDYRGDPASALLEVLDPEQNKDFMDHYLEVPFDLSKVMFITTANTIDTIPRPLLDRMEVIEISGYTEEEKLKIAERYLVPKKVTEHGLRADQVSFSEGSIRGMINYYTRESGVRNLEREIANVCRKVARKVVDSGKKKDKNKVYKLTANNLESYLGKKKLRYDIIEGENEVGVTTGLAWTSVGGDTLFIETTVMDGTGRLVLTGQLGDVMQESAKAGMSYIRSKAKDLELDENFYKEYDIHIHIPEGATPKDGPSAGVTMCASVISALTNRPVRKEIAMTGEITLRGKVLPVGGIKEKVLAAHRAGVKKVLLPAENIRDLDELPTNVKKELQFVPLETMDQVLEEALA